MQLVIFITVSVKWKFSFLQIYAYLYIHLRIKHANFKYHIIKFIRRGIGIFTSQRFIALKKQISSYTLFDPVLVQTTIFMLISFLRDLSNRRLYMLHTVSIMDIRLTIGWSIQNYFPNLWQYFDTDWFLWRIDTRCEPYQ